MLLGFVLCLLFLLLVYESILKGWVLASLFCFPILSVLATVQFQICLLCSHFLNLHFQTYFLNFSLSFQVDCYNSSFVYSGSIILNINTNCSSLTIINLKSYRWNRRKPPLLCTPRELLKPWDLTSISLNIAVSLGSRITLSCFKFCLYQGPGMTWMFHVLKWKMGLLLYSW